VPYIGGVLGKSSGGPYTLRAPGQTVGRFMYYYDSIEHLCQPSFHMLSNSPCIPPSLKLHNMQAYTRFVDTLDWRFLLCWGGCPSQSNLCLPPTLSPSSPRPCSPYPPHSTLVRLGNYPAPQLRILQQAARQCIGQHLPLRPTLLQQCGSPLRRLAPSRAPLAGTGRGPCPSADGEGFHARHKLLAKGK
jgi:hypothetical protein